MENLRINRIVELSGHHDTVADIGTDHGFTSLLLLRTGRATKVIATDISSDSLSKAMRLFEQEGVQDLTECRTGDGLDVLEAGEADACIISGMGGHLIMKMLERDMDKVRAMDRLVITHCENRRKYGEMEPGTTSRFIEEMGLDPDEDDDLPEA